MFINQLTKFLISLQSSTASPHSRLRHTHYCLFKVTSSLAFSLAPFCMACNSHHPPLPLLPPPPQAKECSWNHLCPTQNPGSTAAPRNNLQSSGDRFLYYLEVLLSWATISEQDICSTFHKQSVYFSQSKRIICLQRWLLASSRESAQWRTIEALEFGGHFSPPGYQGLQDPVLDGAPGLSLRDPCPQKLWKKAFPI